MTGALNAFWHQEHLVTDPSPTSNPANDPHAARLDELLDALASAPDYNGGQRLMYPNPVGLVITNQYGRYLGPHAVSIQRVDEDPDGIMRADFFNPNNEGRQSTIEPLSHGLVHGGVYAAMLESVCSVGAALAKLARGHNAVRLEKATRFRRGTRVGARLRAEAVPAPEAGDRARWLATITDEAERCAPPVSWSWPFWRPVRRSEERPSTGRPGHNPLCHHRALEIASCPLNHRGPRETQGPPGAHHLRGSA